MMVNAAPEKERPVRRTRVFCRDRAEALSNLELTQARRKMDLGVFAQRLRNVPVEIFDRANADRPEHPLLIDGGVGSIAHAGWLLFLVVLIVFFLFIQIGR